MMMYLLTSHMLHLSNSNSTDLSWKVSIVSELKYPYLLPYLFYLLSWSVIYHSVKLHLRAYPLKNLNIPHYIVNLFSIFRILHKLLLQIEPNLIIQGSGAPRCLLSVLFRDPGSMLNF